MVSEGDPVSVCTWVSWGGAVVSPRRFGGDEFATANDLAEAIARAWRAPISVGGPAQLIIYTNDKPLLQLDILLINTLHKHKFKITIKTNNTLPTPHNIN